MRSNNQSGSSRRQGGAGARGSSRNVEAHLQEGRAQVYEEEEAIFYTGPPRVNLSSSPARPTRAAAGAEAGGSRVHSFQVESLTATNEAPFVRVGPPASGRPTGPGDNQQAQMMGSSPNEHFLDPISAGLDRIDRMMNAAMNAAGPAAQYFNQHNILVNPASGQQTQRRAPTTNSPLRNKIVYELECCFCNSPICGRAMRAILLADTKVELYSTDVPPSRLRLLDDDRMTQGCNCRIRDTACATWYSKQIYSTLTNFFSGNVMGYHVSQPCEKCLDARNNGHFWMFYSDTVLPRERADPTGNGKPLYWGSLTQAGDFLDQSGLSKNTKPYECFCR